MIAIHKITEERFNVIEARRTSFTGRALQDGEVWKKGQTCHSLNKIYFDLIISWGDYDKILSQAQKTKDSIRNL